MRRPEISSSSETPFQAAARALVDECDAFLENVRELQLSRTVAGKVRAEALDILGRCNVFLYNHTQFIISGKLSDRERELWQKLEKMIQEVQRFSTKKSLRELRKIQLEIQNESRGLEGEIIFEHTRDGIRDVCMIGESHIFEKNPLCCEEFNFFNIQSLATGAICSFHGPYEISRVLGLIFWIRFPNLADKRIQTLVENLFPLVYDPSLYSKKSYPDTNVKPSIGELLSKKFIMAALIRILCRKSYSSPIIPENTIPTVRSTEGHCAVFYSTSGPQKDTLQLITPQQKPDIPVNIPLSQVPYAAQKVLSRDDGQMLEIAISNPESVYELMHASIQEVCDAIWQTICNSKHSFLSASEMSLAA